MLCFWRTPGFDGVLASRLFSFLCCVFGEHLVLMGSLLLVFLAFCVVFFVLFFLVLCLVYSMLSVSLDFSFSIVPSVFSNVYLSKYCMNHLVIGS